MAERITMPKQGLQMTEGTITKWLVAEGDFMEQGRPLFEMETDKLTIVIDAPASGTLLKIVASEGETVPITGLIAVVGMPGDDISALLENGVTDGETVGQKACSGREPALSERIWATPRAKTRAGELGLDMSAIAGSGPESLIVERDVLATGKTSIAATPLARRVAQREGLALGEIAGSGPRGKVTREDVLAAAQLGKEKPAGGEAVLPVTGMRAVIARRMKQSLDENAQATHRVAVRMDEAARARAALDKTVSYNDLIAFAAVRALRDYPAMNSQLVEDGIWRKSFVNLGVAVAVEDGLLVPVVRDAHLLTLKSLASELKNLTARAREGLLRMDECGGGSFTISNLGMYGLEEFVAIINPPEAGILAVGKIEDTPVAENGQVAVRPVMRLTLSYDHRVVDGAPAAQFLVRIKEYLENPYQLL